MGNRRRGKRKNRGRSGKRNKTEQVNNAVRVVAEKIEQIEDIIGGSFDYEKNRPEHYVKLIESAPERDLVNTSWQSWPPMANQGNETLKPPRFRGNTTTPCLRTT
jgi:hypothetical protein